jgi:hypothetical protein
LRSTMAPYPSSGMWRRTPRAKVSISSRHRWRRHARCVLRCRQALYRPCPKLSGMGSSLVINIAALSKRRVARIDESLHTEVSRHRGEEKRTLLRQMPLYSGR